MSAQVLYAQEFYTQQQRHLRSVPAPTAQVRVRAIRRNKTASVLVRVLRDLTICLLLLFPYLMLPML